jgi:hypothetical protein
MKIISLIALAIGLVSAQTGGVKMEDANVRFALQHRLSSSQSITEQLKQLAETDTLNYGTMIEALDASQMYIPILWIEWQENDGARDSNQ